MVFEAVTAFFKSVALGLGLIHDERERKAGADAQLVTDLKSENERLSHALDASVNPPDTLDSLRNGKF